MADDDEPMESRADSRSPSPPGEATGSAADAPPPPGSAGNSGEPVEATGKAQPEPAELAEAWRLVELHLDLEDLIGSEMDLRFGSTPGFASQALRAEQAHSMTRGLQMRAALGVDEEEFQQLMSEELARRELPPESLVRSPFKPRAKNPRSGRTTGPRRADRDDEPSPLQIGVVVRAVEDLQDELQDELIRQGKLTSRLSRRRKAPAS